MVNQDEVVDLYEKISVMRSFRQPATKDFTKPQIFRIHNFILKKTARMQSFPFKVENRSLSCTRLIFVLNEYRYYLIVHIVNLVITKVVHIVAFSGNGHLTFLRYYARVALLQL